MDLERLRYLKNENPGDCRLREVREMAREIEQLMATVERLQGIIAQHELCHDLHGKVNAEDFAKGCVAEQKRIYGHSPHEQEVEWLRSELEHYRRCTSIRDED